MATLTLPRAMYDSEMKSVRRAVNALLGDPPSGPPILMNRDALVDRPFVRVRMPNTNMVSRSTSGWHDGSRLISLTYAGNEWADVLRVMDVIRGGFQRVSAIPFYAYDVAWIGPPVIRLTDPSAATYAGTIPAGTYEVTATAVNHEGEETLASEAATIELASTQGMAVYVPLWPVQAPDHASVRVYLDGVLAGTAAVQAVPTGWTAVMLTSVPDPGAGGPPETSVYRFGSIRVDSVSTNLYESDDEDGEFDGVVMLSLSRELYTEEQFGYRPYGPGEVQVAELNAVSPE